MSDSNTQPADEQLAQLYTQRKAAHAMPSELKAAILSQNKQSAAKPVWQRPPMWGATLAACFVMVFSFRFFPQSPENADFAPDIVKEEVTLENIAKMPQDPAYIAQEPNKKEFYSYSELAHQQPSIETTSVMANKRRARELTEVAQNVELASAPLKEEQELITQLDSVSVSGFNGNKTIESKTVESKTAPSAKPRIQQAQASAPEFMANATREPVKRKKAVEHIAQADTLERIDVSGASIVQTENDETQQENAQRSRQLMDTGVNDSYSGAFGVTGSIVVEAKLVSFDKVNAKAQDCQGNDIEFIANHLNNVEVGQWLEIHYDHQDNIMRVIKIEAFSGCSND